MDQDPIKRLQSFLDERGKMLEKISSIHSTLDSVRAENPPSLTSQPTASISDDPYGALADAQYGRLMQALQDMQAHIEQRIQPAVKLVVQAQVERLRDQSDQQMVALRECLAQIDQSILQCMSGMHEYQRRYADLHVLNKSLTELGAAPEPLPNPIAAERLSDTITARLIDLSQKNRP